MHFHTYNAEIWGWMGFWRSHHQSAHRCREVLVVHKIVYIHCVFMLLCMRVCGCVGVRACASTPAVSLSITFKWAESNQCSQQDPALSLPPFPLSHLNFSPPPCSPLHGAARCLLNWLVQVKSGGLKKKKKTREWVALHHIAKSTVSFIIYPFSK